MFNRTKCISTISNYFKIILNEFNYIFGPSSWKTKFLTILILILISVFCAEFLLYYFVLSVCKWPTIPNQNGNPVRAMILADTHILGPVRGHWFDKMRREWQMHRAFQASMTIFNPEVVFVLGDLFDEGDIVGNQYFETYANRFFRLFQTPHNAKFICAVGNHDVGFHYRLHPIPIHRFEEKFNNTGVELHTIRDVQFVTINSMAMQDDHCYFCEEAQFKLTEISNMFKCAKNEKYCTNRGTEKRIHYSRPVLMQHFPTYRTSDKECLEHDAPKIEKYRENWEVLSKESTRLLGEKLNPRVVFSGHSHHYCKTKTILGIPEYTIASFSWRNKYNPSFLLATFTPTQHAIELCYMPTEGKIIGIYVFGVCTIMFLIIKGLIRSCSRVKTK